MTLKKIFQNKIQVFALLIVFSLVLSNLVLASLSWSIKSLDYFIAGKLPLEQIFFYQFENAKYLMGMAQKFHAGFFSASLFLPSSNLFLPIVFIVLFGIFFLLNQIEHKTQIHLVFLVLFFAWFMQPLSVALFALFIMLLFSWILVQKNLSLFRFKTNLALLFLFFLLPFIALSFLFLPIFLLTTIAHRLDKKKIFFFLPVFLFYSFISFGFYYFLQTSILQNNHFHFLHLKDFIFIEQLPQKHIQNHSYFLWLGIYLSTFFVLSVLAYQVFFIRAKKTIKQNVLLLAKNCLPILVIAILHFYLQKEYLSLPSYVLFQIFLVLSFVYFLFSHPLFFSHKHSKKVLFLFFLFLIFFYSLILFFFFQPLPKKISLPKQKNWYVSPKDISAFPLSPSKVKSIILVDLHIIPENQKKIPYLTIQEEQHQESLFSKQSKDFYLHELKHAQRIFNKIEHLQNQAFFFKSNLPLNKETYPFRRIYEWKSSFQKIPLFLDPS